MFNRFRWPLLTLVIALMVGVCAARPGRQEFQAHPTHLLAFDNLFGRANQIAQARADLDKLEKALNADWSACIAQVRSDLAIPASVLDSQIKVDRQAQPPVFWIDTSVAPVGSR